MVSSRAYPDLERAPGKKDNWVEAAGGLPDYIERIAKHIHYEGGKSISSAIAMAISQCRKWAAQGKAKAIEALAQWEKLKATNAAKHAVKMSARRIRAEVIELALVVGVDGRTRAADTSAGMRKAHAAGAKRKKAGDTVSYGSGPGRAARAKAQSQGKAFKNGRFPIRNVADLNKAKRAFGRVKPEDREALRAFINRRAKELGEPPLGGSVKMARRGPYQRHVKHTQQFGKAKGNLSKPASWQHPYQPKNQTAGALKAKHIRKSDLDSSGHPKPGKADDIKQPLPASAALHGVGRKEQHTGAEAKKSASTAPATKQVEKAPSTTVLKAQRRRLQAKVDAGTATPAERATLNRVISQLKRASRS